MRILTYVGSVSDEHPERYRCAARIMLPDGALHPVIFHGPDKSTVRERATAWWASELEAAKRKHGLTEERIAAIQAGRAKAKAAKSEKKEIEA
jgi:hypothetical protein